MLYLFIRFVAYSARYVIQLLEYTYIKKSYKVLYDKNVFFGHILFL